MRSLAYNRRATFDYTLIETYEAGIVLSGNEVKSIKLSRASLKGSYVTIHQGEAFLINAHIPHYQNHPDITHDPYRRRKLLLKSKEINTLIGQKSAIGLTIIPIEIYLKRGRIKLKIALARGKKTRDKRQSIKERESSRHMERHIKHTE